jgi:hypothetical protein
MRTNGGKEPEVMGVDLKTWDGKDVHLENDGILTMRPIDDVDVVSVLQTRSAFRGFVSALTELMNYTMVDAYPVDRGEGGEE